MKRNCKLLVTLCKCALKGFRANCIEITKNYIILELLYVSMFMDSLRMSIFYLPIL